MHTWRAGGRECQSNVNINLSMPLMTCMYRHRCTYPERPNVTAQPTKQVNTIATHLHCSVRVWRSTRMLVVWAVRNILVMRERDAVHDATDNGCSHRYMEWNQAASTTQLYATKVGNLASDQGANNGRYAEWKLQQSDRKRILFVVLCLCSMRIEAANNIVRHSSPKAVDRQRERERERERERDTSAARIGNDHATR
jgi:hypothetical protein